MKLSIDATQTDAIICLGGTCRTFPSVDDLRRQNVLRQIDKLLKDSDVSLVDISEIYVNTGPGSFTGARVGVSIANALSQSLGVSLFDFAGKKIRLASPFYSGPAHTTQPKKKL